MKVNRDQLISALEAVQPAVDNEKESAADYTGAISMSEEGIFAANSKFHAFNPFPIEGKVSVDCRSLLAVLRKCASEIVEFNASSDGIEIKDSKTRKIKVKGLPYMESLESIKEKPAEDKFDGGFLKLCNRANNIVSNGIGPMDFFDIKKEKIVMCSRTVLVVVESPEIDLKKDMMISRHAVPVLLDLSPTLISEYDTGYSFSNGETTIFCYKGIDQLPDAEKVFNDPADGVVVDLSKIKSALDFARNFNYDGTAKFELKKNGIRISSESTTVEFDNRFKISYDGEPVAFRLNIKTLDAMICESKEIVIFDGSKVQTHTEDGLRACAACISE